MLCAALGVKKDISFFWGRGKVTVALMLSILCVFYLLSLSTAIPTHRHYGPTQLVRPVCQHGGVRQREREGEFNIKTCSFFREKQDGTREERCSTTPLGFAQWIHHERELLSHFTFLESQWILSELDSGLKGMA